MRTRNTRIIKIVGAIVLTPVVLVILLAVALYIPPIQQWAVNRACAYASDKTGMEVSIESVYLAFPLDLSLQGVKCYQQNDSLPQVTDTIAQVGKAVVNVELLPLIDGNINVKALELNQTHLNTANFIHTCRVRGYVGRMMIDASTNSSHVPLPVASVALKSSVAKISSVILDDAHISLELSDTVPKDTTRTETKWKIFVNDIAISNSSLVIHMPGDTLQLGMNLKDVKAKEGYLDLEKGLYNITHTAICSSTFSLDNNFTTRLRRGFDSNHLYFSDISLSVDSINYLTPDTLLNRASDLSCLIRQASFKEQSGIELKSMKAAVKIDSTLFKVEGSLATPSSSMMLSLKMKPNIIDSLDLYNGILDAKIDASLGRHDLMTLAFGNMPESFRRAWPMYPLAIKGELHGNMRQISIPWLTMTLPTAFSLDARGNAKGFMALSRNIFSRQFFAKVHGDLRTYNMSFVKALLDHDTQKVINIPSMHAIADITASGPEYNISLHASEKGGNVTAKARVNASSMNYTADVKASNMNLGHFVMGYNLSAFTGTVNATGHGTNFLAHSTSAKVKAKVLQLHYGQYDLSRINADLLLKNGKLDAQIDADNPLLQGQIAVNGVVGSKNTDITLSANLSKADLYHLKIVDTPLTVALTGNLIFATDMNQYYKIKGSVTDIALKDTARVFHPDDIRADILTRRDTTAAMVDCGDFALKLNAQGGYKWLMGCTGRMGKVLTRHFRERTINQDDIRKELPRMNVSLVSGMKNPVYRLAKYFGVEYKHVDFKMNTSRENGIFADLAIDSLVTKDVKLDSITASIHSTNVDSTGTPSKEIFYNVHIKNNPPNEYVFEAFLDGKVLQHGISVNTKLYDKKNELALLLGAEATMEERGIELHLTPDNPVLGYEPFSLNNDNFVLLAHNNRVHANVNLIATDGTGVKIYCSDEDTEANDDSYDKYLQDLTFSVNKLDLGKITASLPYAPKVEGKLNGDFHVMESEDMTFTLSSDLAVNNMSYEGCKIGNLGTQFTYFPKTDGSHHVDGILTLDEKEIGSIKGSYNFKTHDIDATITCNQFPMEIVNGLIPEKIIGFEGTAEGKMTIQGKTSTPIVNGELFLQDAALLSVPYGIRLRFDDDPVRITNSKLLLENFEMYAPNDEPLLIYGSVNFGNLSHINLDMMMKAQNFQLIKAKETTLSTAYGSVFVNAFAYLKGDLDKLMMRGKLEILPTTNLYYILKDTPITTDNRMKDLVTFTDLSNSANIKIVRPQVDGMDMMLNVVCDEGAHIKAWLDGSHNNYVDIIGNGNLRLTYKNENIGMSGRYTISRGEMKYSLQVIPLKTFTIQEGSYIQWLGDLMNPRLNITALETIKSSVYVNDVSQMVTFKTGVKLTKTVNDMGLEFIIEAPENKTIADELSMRSKEERGKLAVTLLTTGMYFSDGNTSNFSMNSALNTFLQSEINTLAGNALKTVDLSFGMESSTELDGTRHNDYTFKFAKRFWNNRISISVGGKISSGPDVSGQNKSFFNNVDLQYRLSDTSNKYLQLFYKRDIYDYLEGYLSQYGAGFLWKKNTQTFRDIFRKTSSETPAPPEEKKDTLIKFVTPTDKK